MSDRDKGEKGGLTRRELFKSLGTGAIATGLLGSNALSERAAEAAPAGATILGPGAVKLTLMVNGQAHALGVEPRVTLLSALRDHLDLTGAKPVCDRGACGACTVLLDGQPVNACMVLAVDAIGRDVRTVEGLAREALHGGEELTPLQRAFVEHDALQCGFCTPGMVMTCSALLQHNPDPTIDDVRHALAGNLCRCGTYPKIYEAVLAAAKAGPGEKAH